MKIEFIRVGLESVSIVQTIAPHNKIISRKFLLETLWQNADFHGIWLQVEIEKAERWWLTIIK